MGAPGECCRGWCLCVSKPPMFIWRYSGVWSRTLLLPSPPARRNPNNYLRANVGGGPYLQPIALRHEGIAAIAHGVAHFFSNMKKGSSLRPWIHLDGLHWIIFICCWLNFSSSLTNGGVMLPGEMLILLIYAPNLSLNQPVQKRINALCYKQWHIRLLSHIAHPKMGQ